MMMAQQQGAATRLLALWSVERGAGYYEAAPV